MLIYELDSKIYCYIHIPKNSGRFLRKKIYSNENNKIIHSYWHVSGNIDFAHLPYMWRQQYVDSLNVSNVNYYTYTRNPYDRIISTYFFKNPNKTEKDFDNFVNNELPYFDFNTKFDKDIIHYYPQYLFVCDTDFIIKDDVNIKSIETFDSIKKYTLSNYFNNDTIKIINKIYALDFKLFNYELQTTV